MLPKYIRESLSMMTSIEKSPAYLDGDKGLLHAWEECFHVCDEYFSANRLRRLVLRIQGERTYLDTRRVARRFKAIARYLRGDDLVPPNAYSPDWHLGLRYAAEHHPWLLNGSFGNPRDDIPF